MPGPIKTPWVETADVLSTDYLLELGGQRFDISRPQRGDAGAEGRPTGDEIHPDGQPRVSFGLVPAQVNALRAEVGQVARVLDASGQELFLFRIERVWPALNAVVGVPLASREDTAEVEQAP